MQAKEVVIVGYGRTPCTRARKGGLAGMHPVDYAAQALKGVIAKVPNLTAEMVDDVITGCAMPINELNMNTSRLIVNRAELPDSVCGQTINRFCSSGLQAIATANNAIAMGQMKCVIAGGVECMTKCFAPYPEDYMNKWIMENYVGGYMTMGQTAENIVNQYGITREEMDAMAYESHCKAAKARLNGKLAPSIIPVENEKGEIVSYDDGILADLDGNMKTSPEKCASLKTCFVPEDQGGTVTAASSSQTTDAAAYVVLMEAEMAKELGIEPIAKLIGFAVAGCDATVMGLGPIYAVPKALEQTGLTFDDIDVIELNEAFASQAIACIRDLNMPKEKINPYGGAMALGHPMGATGAFLTGKALDYLQDPETKGKYGMVTMCIGGGMGAAGIFEMLK